MPNDAPSTFVFEPSASRVADDARALMLVDPGFGRVFTDHMAIAATMRRRAGRMRGSPPGGR